MLKFQDHQYKAALTPEQEFLPAGNTVDGRVVRDDVPNTESIAASLYEYTVLPGIREVAMNLFGDNLDLYNMFYAAHDMERARDLARLIEASKEISPLIVVVDQEGPYILEGAHRAAALYLLQAKAFPALVVIDEDETEG